LPQLAPDIYRCNNDNASGNGNESAYLTVSYYIVEILETRILVEDHGTLLRRKGKHQLNLRNI
jgi:hypothetical protein